MTIFYDLGDLKFFFTGPNGRRAAFNPAPRGHREDPRTPAPLPPLTKTKNKIAKLPDFSCLAFARSALCDQPSAKIGTGRIRVDEKAAQNAKCKMENWCGASANHDRLAVDSCGF